ncbi:MAG TPA: hypothetical protein VKA64_05015 [Gammaproteobacteria bacterium]|nr:hypothetical protein [Gammaproteobacteria bacterium]
METAYSPWTGASNAAAVAVGLRTKDTLHHGLVLITPARARHPRLPLRRRSHFKKPLAAPVPQGNVSSLSLAENDYRFSYWAPKIDLSPFYVKKEMFNGVARVAD